MFHLHTKKLIYIFRKFIFSIPTTPFNFLPWKLHNDSMRCANFTRFPSDFLILRNFRSEWEGNSQDFSLNIPDFSLGEGYTNHSCANVRLCKDTIEGLQFVRVFRKLAVPSEGTIYQNKVPRGRHARLHCCLLMLFGKKTCLRCICPCAFCLLCFLWFWSVDNVIVDVGNVLNRDHFFYMIRLVSKPR